MKYKGILNFFKRLFKRLNEVQISFLAAQISFSLVMAFFPFLIFVLTLINESHIDSSLFVLVLKHYLPEDIFKLATNIMENARQQKNLAISLGGIMGTLWVSTNAASSLSSGINKIYHKQKPRGFLRRTGLSLVMTAAFVLLIFLTTTLLLFGERIGIMIFDFFGVPQLFENIWNYLRYELSVLFLIGIFLIVYLVMPNKKLKFWEVLPGAIFSAFMWLIMSYLFSFYINNFFRFASIYGSIGGIILLLIWLNLGMHIILIGAGINATLDKGQA